MKNLLISVDIEKMSTENVKKWKIKIGLRCPTYQDFYVFTLQNKLQINTKI